jgi:hypothetical protein
MTFSPVIYCVFDCNRRKSTPKDRRYGHISIHGAPWPIILNDVSLDPFIEPLSP